MRRIAMTAVTAAMLVAVLGATIASASSPQKVSMRNTSAGMILVNSKGFTVYAFSRDSNNSDKCVTIKGCAANWPPLTTSGKPVAGSGIKSSMLSTITIKGGAKQVTYAGHPLYTYIGDSSPGSTEYIGVNAAGGTWPALNAAGGEVK